MVEQEKMLGFCIPILTKRKGFIGNTLLTPEQAKQFNFILCKLNCCHKPCWIPEEADQNCFECDGKLE